MYLNIETLKASYAPYNQIVGFEVGYRNGIEGRYTTSPYSNDTVNAQAYDRGLECGNKVHSHNEWIKANVGAN